MKINTKKIALSQYMAAINMCDWAWANKLEAGHPHVKEEYEKLLGA